MMMMSSAVNKQSNLHPLSAMGNAKKPAEAHKQEAGAAAPPKLDLVDAKEDSFEFASSPREAVADATPTPAGDTLSLSTPPAVAPPAPAKPSMLAIGAGILATAASAGAIYLGFKNNELGEKIADQAKKIDLIDGIKTAGEATAKLAKEAKDFADTHIADLTGRLQNAQDHAKGVNDHLVRNLLKAGFNELVDADVPRLLAHQKENPATSDTLLFVLEGLNSQTSKIKNSKAVLAEVLPLAKQSVTASTITGHLNSNVRESALVLNALLEAKAKFPNFPTLGTDAQVNTTAMDTYRKAVEGFVQAEADKITDPRLKSQVEAFKSFANHTDEKALNDQIIVKVHNNLNTFNSHVKRSISPELSEFANLKPDGTVDAYKNLDDVALANFKERILLPVNNKALTAEQANFILIHPNAKADPELLVHLAGTLTDLNHPLASDKTLGTQLRTAIVDYATGVVGADGAKSKPLANSLVSVSDMLANTAADTSFDITKSPFAGADADTQAFVKKFHASTADAPLQPKEALQYLQAQLGEIAKAVKADNPTPPVKTS
jgi:hypothetical protein